MEYGGDHGTETSEPTAAGQATAAAAGAAQEGNAHITGPGQPAAETEIRAAPEGRRTTRAQAHQ